jgi:hypothetical protein
MTSEEPTWIKSTRSGANGQCVEVAFLPGGRVSVRDSKRGGAGPELTFLPGEWDAFIGGVVDGEFERPTSARAR